MTGESRDKGMTNRETPTEGASLLGRKEVIGLLKDGIREAHRKVESGRVYDCENERVRMNWIRTLAYASNQYRQLKKDDDLEELDERLSRLEE